MSLLKVYMDPSNKKDPAFLATELSIFFSVTVPSISLKDYVHRVIKYSSCDVGTIMIGAVYILRFILRINMTLNLFNIHRLLITSFTIARKYSEDRSFSNRFMAGVGGVPKAELNEMEVLMLEYLDFDLGVCSTMFEGFCKEAVNVHLQLTGYETSILSSSADSEEGEEHPHASSQQPFLAPQECNGCDDIEVKSDTALLTTASGRRFSGVLKLNNFRSFDYDTKLANSTELVEKEWMKDGRKRDSFAEDSKKEEKERFYLEEESEAEEEEEEDGFCDEDVDDDDDELEFTADSEIGHHCTLRKVKVLLEQMKVEEEKERFTSKQSTSQCLPCQ